MFRLDVPSCSVLNTPWSTYAMYSGLDHLSSPDPDRHITVYLLHRITDDHTYVYSAHIHYNGDIPHAKYKNFTSDLKSRKHDKIKIILTQCHNTPPRPLVANWT